MAEDKAQSEMSKAIAIEMSNFKKQTRLHEEDAKNQRMKNAIDFLVELCRKKNRGEELSYGIQI